MSLTDFFLKKAGKKRIRFFFCKNSMKKLKRKYYTSYQSDNFAQLNYEKRDSRFMHFRMYQQSENLMKYLT